MNFILEHPFGLEAARGYAASAIFENCLGLPVKLEPVQRTNWCLRDEARGSQLEMPDSFFSQAGPVWLRPDSIPYDKLQRWRPNEVFAETDQIEPELPIIAGQQNSDSSYWQFEEAAGKKGWLGLDILGSAFFLLSRYEEVADPQTDIHGRFPATASISARERFLERPILDEYIEVLWAAMKRIWPSLKRRQSQGKIHYSCDVDIPYEPSVVSQTTFLRSLGGDVIKRRSLTDALNRMSAVRSARKGDFSKDPNNSFDRIMDLCETNGVNAAFYFIAGHSAGKIDGCYSLDEPYIRDLLRQINERGHEIGLHGNYNSFCDGEMLRLERSNLQETCQNSGITAKILGNRQHYLRWDSSITPGVLADAGFNYDTTGGFADAPGFRFGTGRSFPMWDWRTEQKIDLIQRPLLVMECSVIAKKYLGLGYEKAAMDKMQLLKSRAMRYGGDFNFLWHNSHLSTPKDWRFLNNMLLKS